jgi:PAS domain S-box-containing protein
MAGSLTIQELHDFEFLANSIPHPVLVFVDISEIKFFNNSAVSLFEPDIGSDKNIGFSDLLYAPDLGKLKRMIADQLPNGEGFEMGLRFRKPIEGYTWFTCKFSPKIAGGIVEKWFCSAEIMDEESRERRKLKEEVSRNQYLVKQIADATPDVLYVLDIKKGKSIFTNRHVKDVLGYSSEEIYKFKGDLLHELLHPDDIEIYRYHLNSFKEDSDDVVKEFQCRVYDKEGKLHWIKERQKIFKRDENGVPIQLIGISQDITEQKIKEEKIRKQQELILQSEMELKKAQEIANIGSFSFNLISRKFIASFGLEHILGASLIDYSYSNYLNFIYPEDLPRFKLEMRRALYNQSDFFIEHRLYTLDGNQRWVITRGKVIGDKFGNLEKINGIVHDITEKKMMDIKVEEQQKFIQLIANALPDIFYVYDISSGTNVFYNRTFKEFLGYTNHDHADDPDFVRSVMHPEDLIRMPEDIQRIMQCKDGEVLELEYRMMHFDGKYRWLVGRDSVFARDENGKPTQILGVAHDITQRKNTEEELKRLNDELEDIVEERTLELKKNEEQLRLITDALPVLIAYVDKGNHFNFVNKAYEEWFDVPVLFIRGMKVRDLLKEGNFAKVEPYINEVMCGHQVQFEINLELPFKDSRRVSATYIPHKENGVVQGYYELVSDITYRKQVEENLVKALKEADAKNTELTKVNEVLDTFVYAAAHDLKSPVTNLKLFLELINKATDHQKKDEYLGVINASVSRLDNIIKGLVEVIQVQSNLQPSIKDIIFEDIFQYVSQEQEANLNKIGGVFSRDFNLCQSIIYKEAYLLSVVRNLVSNAIKYHSSERPLIVSIRTALEGEYTLLIIEDNGIGIDLDRYGKNLFKPFKRFSKQSEGTGIGLHLIKSIVEKNGGKIEVKSKPGMGASFIVYLKQYQILN